MYFKTNEIFNYLLNIILWRVICWCFYDDSNSESTKLMTTSNSNIHKIHATFVVIFITFYPWEKSIVKKGMSSIIIKFK